jgi:hypothetical protein
MMVCALIDDVKLAHWMSKRKDPGNARRGLCFVAGVALDDQASWLDALPWVPSEPWILTSLL